MLKAILEIPTSLSADQRKAVLSKSRYLRIIAGAGTGKTETLTRRIIYLLLCEDEEPSTIVAFTFTERAAQSMKNRIYERIRELKGEDACARLGEMYLNTIHGFCLRILEDFFGYGNYSVLDENQEMAFIMREGWKFGLGTGGRYAENCRNFLKSVNVVCDNLVDRDELRKRNEDFTQHLEDYETTLDAHRLLTFGRIVALAVEKLEANKTYLEDIRYLLVDEYQDINRAQEKLIELIGQKASVFIVGDPRQSIYQWRGSDERCFDDFLRKFPDPDIVSIKENRRSRRDIVWVANTFAETFERAKYEPLMPELKEEGQVFLTECSTNLSEAEWIARQIKYLTIEKKVCNFSDIALLLRSVTTSARPFLDVFQKKEYNFPFLVGGKVGLFQREEAQVVGRLFAWLGESGFWVEDPYNWRIQTRGDELVKTALKRWDKVLGSIELLKELPHKLNLWKRNVLHANYKNFKEVYQELLKILGFLSFDPLNKLQAAVIANLGRLNALLTDYEASIRLGGEKVDWVGALKGLCWYINTHATGAYEEQPAEDLRGVEAIQIMTVHQAKGLEWPVVFVPCLVSRRFPSSKIGSQQEWYVPREIFDVSRYEGSIEDERRLFYVAITRARDVLCLTSFRRIKNRVSHSQFLDSIKNKAKKLTEPDKIIHTDIKKGIEIDEIQTFSAGEIITYLKCPYMYRLREDWGYQAGLVPELGYGRSLHHCLRHIAEYIQKGLDWEKSIHEIVQKEFHLPYAGGKQRQTMMKAAKEALTKFVKQNLEDMKRVEEVESRLEFPLQKATLTGKVDVIVKGEDNSTLEVRDYKTSEEVTTFEEANLQVRLYALGLKTIGRSVGLGSIANLDTAEIKPVSIKQEELNDAKKIAEKCINDIMQRSFTGRRGSHCNNCDFKKICKWSSGSE